MFNRTILTDEVGFQVDDIQLPEENKMYSRHIMLGQFKRGALDRPMRINKLNVAAMLGHEPWNPDYINVVEALDTGIDYIDVLRISNGVVELPDPIDPPPDPVDPPDPIDPPPENQIKPFDYAVIRYIWDTSSGRDMDTRTIITAPPRDVAVGWAKEYADRAYLIWGGDNVTVSGSEDVLLDFKGLKNDYPNQTVFEILLKAFWFAETINGNFKIQFATYKGGEMRQEGFNFINEGGLLVQSLLIDRHTTENKELNGTEGMPVAKLTFNTVENKGLLIKIDN